MQQLNLYEKWDTEGPVTPLRLNSSHPPDSALSISSFVAPTDPFCNQFISHSWNFLLTFILKWLIANYKPPDAFQIWAKTIDNLKWLINPECEYTLALPATLANLWTHFHKCSQEEIQASVQEIWLKSGIWCVTKKKKANKVWENLLNQVYLISTFSYSYSLPWRVLSCVFSYHQRGCTWVVWKCGLHASTPCI